MAAGFVSGSTGGCVILEPEQLIVNVEVSGSRFLQDCRIPHAVDNQDVGNDCFECAAILRVALNDSSLSTETAAETEIDLTIEVLPDRSDTVVIDAFPNGTISRSITENDTFLLSTTSHPFLQFGTAHKAITSVSVSWETMLGYPILWNQSQFKSLKRLRAVYTVMGGAPMPSELPIFLLFAQRGRMDDIRFQVTPRITIRSFPWFFFKVVGVETVKEFSTAAGIIRRTDPTPSNNLAAVVHDAEDCIDKWVAALETGWLPWFYTKPAVIEKLGHATIRERLDELLNEPSPIDESEDPISFSTAPSSTPLFLSSNIEAISSVGVGEDPSFASFSSSPEQSEVFLLRDDTDPCDVPLPPSPSPSDTFLYSDPLDPYSILLPLSPVEPEPTLSIDPSTIPLPASPLETEKTLFIEDIDPCQIRLPPSPLQLEMLFDPRHIDPCVVPLPLSPIGEEVYPPGEDVDPCVIPLPLSPISAEVYLPGEDVDPCTIPLPLSPLLLESPGDIHLRDFSLCPDSAGKIIRQDSPSSTRSSLFSDTLDATDTTSASSMASPPPYSPILGFQPKDPYRT